MCPSIRERVAETVLGILVVLVTLVPGAWSQADVQGQWSTLPYLMPTDSVHTELLYNGKVLIIAGSKSTDGTPSKEAALWDPQAGTITTQSTSWYMFCNGMVAFPDGRVLIDGGTIQSNPFLGSAQAAIYDPATNTFTNTANMAHGRWYPTLTTLSDGRIMTFSGLNETNGATNNAVEIYTVGSGWSSQYVANWTPPLYPRMHLLPSGNVFYSGSANPSRLFNPTTHTWTTVGNTNLGSIRTYGSSVLLSLTPANNYRPKVMLLGGGIPTATATTEIIDLGASSPAWQWGPDMSQARVEMDAVLLPNGKILAVGGSSTDEDASTASLNADLYDPDTNSFSSAGKNTYPRLYHTESLLMPDATVWLAGSNPSSGVYEQHMEIYKPAYLFTRDANNNVVAAARPTITSAPSAINWSTQFTVSTPDAASIASAVLMRLGSSTHGQDMEARLVGLSFTAGSGTLILTGPPTANIAPPGYYMLFLLNQQGVPSVAKILSLGGSGPPPPPPGGITFVQSNSGPATIQASNTTVAVSYTASQTAGDTNIVVVGWGDTSSTISSVTDSKSNSYALAVGPTSGTGLRQSTYYAKNIAGGSTTVTVTFNKAAAYPDVRVLEYSGLDASTPLDKAVGAAGSGTTANSGTVSTTTASELIFGAGTSGSSFTGAGSGFTSRMINRYGNIAEDKTAASTGSYNATATEASGVWVMQVATFRGSGQNPPPPPPAPTVSSISPVSGTTAGGTAVTITGTGFTAGATVNFGGTAATGRERDQQHDYHSDDGGACSRRGGCGSDQHGCAEWDAVAGLHLYDAGESGADSELDLAGVRNDGGGDAGDHHGHGLPGGSDGEFRRNAGDGRGREQQHDHHGDGSGACGGGGERGGDQHRRTEWDAEQRIYVHDQRGRREHRVCAVEFGAGNDPGVEHDGSGDLRGGADGGRYEHRGDRLGRYQLDHQFGDRQQVEQLCAGGGADERDRAAAVDLLRPEHRGRQHDGDGDVQQGGGVSGCADLGIQRAGPERAAG